MIDRYETIMNNNVHRKEPCGDHLWFTNLLDNLVCDVGRTCALGVSGDAGRTGDVGVSNEVRQEECGVRLGKEAPVRPQPNAATAGQLKERREVAGGRHRVDAHEDARRRRHHRHELRRVHVEPERRGGAAAAAAAGRRITGALTTVLLCHLSVCVWSADAVGALCVSLRIAI